MATKSETVQAADQAGVEEMGGVVEMTEEEARALGIDDATDEDLASL